MSRDSYKRRQAAYSSDITTAPFNSNNPSYYQVYKNFDYTTRYDVQIVNDHSYRGDTQQKKIIAYPGDMLYKGDIIHWKSTDDYWLIKGIDDQYESNTKGLIKQCSDSLLKWRDQYGTIHTLPCVIEDASGGDLNDGKVLWAIDDTIRVFTQYDNGITKGTRFILWGQVFFVTGFSRVGGKNNLSAVYNMDITESNDQDDFVNNIAYNAWDDNTWSIEVLNSPISMTTGDTVTLDVAVKKNGNAVNETLIYLSNNTSIATVSTNGVITGVAEGSTSIKISLSSNPAVFTTVNVEVAAVASDNFVISLVSANSEVDNANLTITLYKDTDASLTIQERNNGDLVNTSFTPALSSGSNYVSLTKTGSNTFILSPTSTGDAILVIEDLEGHVVTYQITIYSLF